MTFESSWEQAVEEYITARLNLKHLSKTFAPGRRLTLRAFGRDHGIRLPSEVTKEVVQRYYLSLRDRGIKANTAQSYVLSVRAMFNWLAKQSGLKGVNPAAEIEMERIVRRYNHQFLAANVVTRLIEDCPYSDLKFCLLCGFDAGLRRGEISEARPEWFSVKGALHVRHLGDFESKDGDERVIPLTKRFQLFIHHHRFDGAYVLHPEAKQGKSRYRYDFERKYYKYLKAQKLEWPTIQTMRHSFASNLIAAGVDIYKVAKWLGDGVEVVQRHYGHLSPLHDEAIYALEARPKGDKGTHQLPYLGRDFIMAFNSSISITPTLSAEPRLLATC